MDIDQPIVGAIQTGKTLIDEMRKKYVDAVHFAMTGDGDGTLAVVGQTDSYSYSFPIRAAGVSRAKPGRAHLGDATWRSGSRRRTVVIFSLTASKFR